MNVKEMTYYASRKQLAINFITIGTYSFSVVMCCNPGCYMRYCRFSIG